MNVNQIEIALSQKISASSSNFDLLAASKALQLLKTNGVFVASNYDGLPAAASNEGKIYFIEDIETVVWSNGATWLTLLDKTPFTQLWMWGGQYGACVLGTGFNTGSSSPVREFCSATDWCQIDTGTYHNAAIKTSGQIWGWGRNNIGNCFTAGHLGDGTTVNKCSPVREICSATDWCQVSAGSNTTTAVKTSGELWAWGDGGSGQLGNGIINTRSCSPVREFCSATDWCQVSTGNIHTAAVKTTGQLWAWGNNICGRLGDGTTTNRCSPVREFCSATDWCGVNASGCHTVAIKTSGQIWSWGNNGFGRLGDGTTTTRCSPVRERCSATDWCGVSANQESRHTLAIKTSGQIWGWGYNQYGQMGDGIAGYGTCRCSPVREFCSATDWCQVSAGDSHSAAVKTSGQIWAWGANFRRQIGDGSTVARCSPVREFCSETSWCQVSAGGNHTGAIKIA